MTTDREADEAWLASVLREELPMREGRYALTPWPREGAAATAPLPQCVWSDDRFVGVRLRLRAPTEASEVCRAVPLVARSKCGDRRRAEHFVKAWCSVLRRALRDLATSALPDAPRFTVDDLGEGWVHAAILQRKRLETRDDFAAVLSERKHLGRFFAIPPAAAGAGLELVHAVLFEKSPILKSDTMLFRALDTPWNDDVPPPGPSRGGVRVHWSGVVAAFELTLLGANGARDTRQEEIELVPGEFLDDIARVETCLRAWRDVLAEHASLIAPDELPFTMPHELTAPEVLATPRAVTRDDFRLAFARRWHFAARQAQRLATPAPKRR
jgi:hypothetical protein